MERLVLRGALWVAALAIALIFGVLAAVFLCGALYLHFEAVTGPPLAALITAGLALVIAILVLLVAWSVSAMGSADGIRQPARPKVGPGRRPAGPVEDQLAAELGSLIGREFTGFAKEHAFQAALASLGAGFAVGAFHPRRMLTTLMSSSIAGQWSPSGENSIAARWSALAASSRGYHHSGARRTRPSASVTLR